MTHVRFCDRMDTSVVRRGIVKSVVRRDGSVGGYVGVGHACKVSITNSD